MQRSWAQKDASKVSGLGIRSAFHFYPFDFLGWKSTAVIVIRVSMISNFINFIICFNELEMILNIIKHIMAVLITYAYFVIFTIESIIMFHLCKTSNLANHFS